MKASLLCERCPHPARPATYAVTLERAAEGRRTKLWRERLCTEHYVKVLAGQGANVVRGREVCVDCNHLMTQHKRAVNGAYRCASFGCGCETATVEGSR